MAETVELNVGTGGALIATDRVAGQDYQIIKIDVGADGAVTGPVSTGNPLPVTVIGGGGTQYTEGDTDATITGTAMLMEGAGNVLVVAQGTAADGLLVNLGTNNDVTVAGVATAANQTTLIGHVDGIEGLLTTIDADTGALAGAVATLGTTTYTETTTQGLIIGALRRDADTTAVNTTNEIAPLLVDANGYLKVEIFDGGASHTVDNAGTFVVQENGAALTALQLIDDTVFTLGTDTYTEATTKGLMIGAVRRDADTTLVNTTNEIAPLQIDANGRLKVEIFDGGDSHTVDGTVSISGTVTVDSELPTAAALADNTANPTVPAVGAFAMVWDGANWDRVPGTSADGVTVNLGTNNDVINAGTFAVQESGSALTALQLIDDAIVADNAAFTDGTTKLDMAGYIYDEVAGTALTENDAAAARINVNRAQVQVVEDGATRGRYATVSAANALKVDGSAVTQPVSAASGAFAAGAFAAGATSIAEDEDVASAGGDRGIKVMAIREDTPVANANVSLSGDYRQLGLDNMGKLWVAGVYKEDEASADADRGMVVMARRTATPANTSGTDLDYEMLQMAAGRLWTSATVDAALPAGTNNIGDVDVLSVVPGTGATALGKAIDTAAGATDTGVAVLAVRDDALTTLTPVDGDYVPLRTDSTGRVWGVVNVDQMNGVAVTMGNGVSGTGVQRVTLASDSTGNIATIGTSVTPGTGATNLGKAEDGAHTTGDVGVMALAVSNEANTARAADGDYLPIATDTEGNVRVVGNRDHDAVDAGEPVKVGARALTSPKGMTLVANADRTDLMADADGMLMVKLNTGLTDLVSERVSNTDGASTAFTNFSAVASTRNYVTAYSMFRTDAGTTPIYVDLRDGTAGSVLWSVVLPPNGGANLSSAFPLFKTTANTALAFDVSAATTTVYISVSGFQSKAG